MSSPKLTFEPGDRVFDTLAMRGLSRPLIVVRAATVSTGVWVVTPDEQARVYNNFELAHWSPLLEKFLERAYASHEIRKTIQTPE